MGEELTIDCSLDVTEAKDGFNLFVENFFGLLLAAVGINDNHQSLGAVRRYNKQKQTQDIVVTRHTKQGRMGSNPRPATHACAATN